ncbi:hypothetical protein [Wolbachia endosymbiont of Drosophila pseudotakahashii]|uniref:hypothetical protein n=1 Tax=Wolbachia endosymbiont of Drosophila pseudotakahashii TaxID=375919 RepID=UPI002250A5CB|nr:hypothetical protein [Wolbachia endosymbiont of Drosophila pseudotakahashii]MCX3065553.1 hypothetical protein [Wolbachia endosymbiont of Drosophila pseudotakahashii]
MLAIKFLDPSSHGTGMTGEGGYLDDTLLVDSNHNVRTVMCFDTEILEVIRKQVNSSIFPL